MIGDTFEVGRGARVRYIDQRVVDYLVLRIDTGPITGRPILRLARFDGERWLPTWHSATDPAVRPLDNVDEMFAAYAAFALVHGPLEFPNA